MDEGSLDSRLVSVHLGNGSGGDLDSLSQVNNVSFMEWLPLGIVSFVGIIVKSGLLKVGLNLLKFSFVSGDVGFQRGNLDVEVTDGDFKVFNELFLVRDRFSQVVDSNFVVFVKEVTVRLQVTEDVDKFGLDLFN